MRIRCFIVLVVCLLFFGCKKSPRDNLASRARQSEIKSFSEQRADMAKKQSGKLKEVYVQNSVPVSPGALVDILDGASSPEGILIEQVVVQKVRWKIPGPFQKPTYPASGFVQIQVTEQQWASIK